ncbi:PLP-dependent transferase [Lecanosticta acicola]|uniref:PLP-dependent transferase n=1 Tax=Lecanosticta acicola TaxID=111012 RepID=A0AAI8Z841_9PEZI|nr:PLP-dependent transferase [Lecanosticta acicola]
MLSNGLSQIAPDHIFEVTALYNRDPNPNKANLGQGTYKTNEGKPFVFPAVQTAKERLLNSYHEYLPILGYPAFREEAKKLVFGEDAAAVKENRVATSQALSGTGSLHLAGSFLRRVCSSTTTVHITNPTWSNHRAVFETVGFPVKSYEYLDSAGRFDFSSLLTALQNAHSGDIFILHAVAHNPSGCDPSPSQWSQIRSIMQAKQLFPLLDAAYLGLTSGDFDADAWAIRHFASHGMEIAVCVSFAKNMGLYSERAGALHFVTTSEAEVRVVESHLEWLIRSEISNPPAFGARVAAEVLGDEALRGSWKEDLRGMTLRLKAMRARLVEELKRLGCPKNFDHVVEEAGMFTILGLTRGEVHLLRDEYSIYMADSSRISVAGLNEGNVVYIAEAINAICSATRQPQAAGQQITPSL